MTIATIFGWIAVVVLSYLILAVVCAVFRQLGWLNWIGFSPHSWREAPQKQQREKKNWTNCAVCGGINLRVTARGGLSENVVCNGCGSLHQTTLFGLTLLRAGSPSPKVVLPDGTKEEFQTDDEALRWAAAWNVAHGVRPGAYVIDSEGVMATDPLHPITDWR